MTTTISDEYRKLNTMLHEGNNNFGAKGYKVASMIWSSFIKPLDIKSIIDYGCGKATLSMELKDKYGYANVLNFDPCVPAFNHKNLKDDSAHGLVCTDVLEHIEPEHLDAVLADINRLSPVHFLRISLVPSNKTLPDGRNAHLIVKPSDWWKERLESNGFVVKDVIENETHASRPEVVNYTVITERNKKGKE